MNKTLRLDGALSEADDAEIASTDVEERARQANFAMIGPGPGRLARMAVMLRPVAFAGVLALCVTGAANGEILPMPAKGETFWGLGSTGVICTATPCVQQGVFPIQRDGSRGLPLSNVDPLRPPALQAESDIRSRIEAAYAQGRCVVAEGHFEGPILVVRKLLGECLPI